MRQGAKQGRRCYLVRPPAGLRSSKRNSERGVQWPGQAEVLLLSVTLLAQPRACGVRTQPGHRWPQAPGIITFQVRSALSPLPIPQNWKSSQNQLN